MRDYIWTCPNCGKRVLSSVDQLDLPVLTCDRCQCCRENPFAEEGEE